MKFLIIWVGFLFLGNKTLTEKNLEGQKYLFNKGWHIIPSGSEAWSKFKDDSLVPARIAMSKALKEVSKNSYKMQSIKEYLAHSKKTIQGFSASSNNLEEKIYKFADSLNQNNSVSFKYFSAAKMQFVLGYMKLEERTLDEKQRLKSYFKNYLEDYKEITKRPNYEFLRIKKNILKDYGTDWHGSFVKAGSEFSKEYHQSGKRSNSLLGLWDIFKGYGKSIYFALVKPSVEESKIIIQKSVIYLSKFAFDVGAIFVSGLYTTGLNFYHAGSYGVKLVSPSLDAGALMSLSTLTYIGAKSSQVVLKSTGTLAKYAVVATGVITGAGEVITKSSFDATRSILYKTSTLGIGAGEAIIETGIGAVSIGYTALIQLSAQTLLGAINSTIFLAYDGPRILILKITGDDIQDIPSGTVIDINQLDKKKYEIEEMPLSEEEKLKVLRNLQ